MQDPASSTDGFTLFHVRAWKPRSLLNLLGHRFHLELVDETMSGGTTLARSIELSLDGAANRAVAWDVQLLLPGGPPAWHNKTILLRLHGLIELPGSPPLSLSGRQPTPGSPWIQVGETHIDMGVVAGCKSSGSWQLMELPTAQDLVVDTRPSSISTDSAESEMGGSVGGGRARAGTGARRGSFMGLPRRLSFSGSTRNRSSSLPGIVVSQPLGEVLVQVDKLVTSSSAEQRARLVAYNAAQTIEKEQSQRARNEEQFLMLTRQFEVMMSKLVDERDSLQGRLAQSDTERQANPARASSPSSPNFRSPDPTKTQRRRGSPLREARAGGKVGRDPSTKPSTGTNEDEAVLSPRYLEATLSASMRINTTRKKQLARDRLAETFRALQPPPVPVSASPIKLLDQRQHDKILEFKRQLDRTKQNEREQGRLQQEAERAERAKLAKLRMQDRKVLKELFRVDHPLW